LLWDGAHGNLTGTGSMPVVMGQSGRKDMGKGPEWTVQNVPQYMRSYD